MPTPPRIGAAPVFGDWARERAGQQIMIAWELILASDKNPSLELEGGLDGPILRVWMQIFPQHAQQLTMRPRVFGAT